jgi:DNA polymerase sigma
LHALKQYVSISVDITISTKGHQGLYSCAFVRECLARRSIVLPSVIKVLKTLLHAAGLNAPFSGGLSSYSIVLMACAAHDLYPPLSAMTEGGLLFFFLDLFSQQHFVPSLRGVTVRGSPSTFSLFELTEEQSSTIGNSPWITDPFDDAKSVARSSFNFCVVQLFLADVAFVLRGGAAEEDLTRILRTAGLHP